MRTEHPRKGEKYESTEPRRMCAATRRLEYYSHSIAGLMVLKWLLVGERFGAYLSSCLRVAITCSRYSAVRQAGRTRSFRPAWHSSRRRAVNGSPANVGGHRVGENLLTELAIGPVFQSESSVPLSGVFARIRFDNSAVGL